MTNKTKVDILNTLYSKGPLSYLELKALSGFKSKKETEQFARFITLLYQRNIISLNTEKKYDLTNVGRRDLKLYSEKISQRVLKLFNETLQETIEIAQGQNITNTGGTFRVIKYGPESIVKDSKVKSIRLVLTRDEAAKMSAFLNTAITQIIPTHKKTKQEKITITLFDNPGKKSQTNKNGYATTVTWR